MEHEDVSPGLDRLEKDGGRKVKFIRLKSSNQNKNGSDISSLAACYFLGFDKCPEDDAPVLVYVLFCATFCKLFTFFLLVSSSVPCVAAPSPR